MLWRDLEKLSGSSKNCKTTALGWGTINKFDSATVTSESKLTSLTGKSVEMLGKANNVKMIIFVTLVAM